MDSLNQPVDYCLNQLFCSTTGSPSIDYANIDQIYTSQIKEIQYLNTLTASTIATPIKTIESLEYAHKKINETNIQLILNIINYERYFKHHETMLDLSDLKCTRIPDALFTLSRLQDYWKNLEHLQCNPYNTSLPNFPESISALINLKTLIIKKAGITALPHGIGNLQNLISIDISENQLVSLPESITQLSNLKYFFCQENLLMRFPLPRQLSYNSKHVCCFPQNVPEIAITEGGQH